jgi:hypothetical protein
MNWTGWGKVSSWFNFMFCSGTCLQGLKNVSIMHSLLFKRRLNSISCIILQKWAEFCSRGEGPSRPHYITETTVHSSDCIQRSILLHAGISFICSEEEDDEMQISLAPALRMFLHRFLPEHTRKFCRRKRQKPRRKLSPSVFTDRKLTQVTGLSLMRLNLPRFICVSVLHLTTQARELHCRALTFLSTKVDVLMIPQAHTDLFLITRTETEFGADVLLQRLDTEFHQNPMNNTDATSHYMFLQWAL